MLSYERHQLRQFYFQTWQKFKNQQPLEPLEREIVAVIQEHAEYIPFIEKLIYDPDQDFPPEFGQTNPFLHLSLHLSLREQIHTNRPRGIYEIFLTLSKKSADQHQVEHQMLEVLAENLWQAQRDQQLPDEESYLKQLREL
ncbi:MAG: DUF1841 family protein [Legionellales bacterium]|nr:DUF1841 family protein [Legionellales bacterium]